MCQMAGCNCHKHACYFRAKFKDMGTAIGLTVSPSGCHLYNCWPRVLVSDKCAKSNMEMVKMSTDTVAIMAGLLVWYKYNRHAH